MRSGWRKTARPAEIRPEADMCFVGCQGKNILYNYVSELNRLRNRVLPVEKRRESVEKGIFSCPYVLCDGVCR